MPPEANSPVEPDARPLSQGQWRSARQLLQRRGRRKVGRFLAEGPQAVREALAAGVVELVITDDPDRHRVLLADRGVPVALAGSAELAELSGTEHGQGLLAVCRIVPAVLDELAGATLVVICAQVRDPGNAGTVIRCADAFGADGVILSSGSVELHNAKTVRASVGSIFHLPVVTGVTTGQAVDWARGQGLRVLAAETGGRGLDELSAAGQLSGPVAWLLGNEAWGLPEADRQLADESVGVPMWGRAESLNLSTAAAVCLYVTASAQRSRLDNGFDPAVGAS